MNRSTFGTDFFMPLSAFESLGDHAKRYASELAQELGTTQEMVACALLGIFAAAQTGVRCDVSRNHQVQMSLYFAVGAPPSSGKTPLVKRVSSTLYSIIDNHILISSEEIRKRIVRIEMYEEDRKSLKKQYLKQKSIEKKIEIENKIIEIDKKISDLEIPVTPIMGKMSTQSFRKELSIRKGRGIIISAEGGFLPDLKNVATSEHIPILQAWSNEAISDITKNCTIHMENTSLVMFAMWQSCPLREFFLDTKNRENGSVARFLLYIENNWQPKSGQGYVSDESESWYKRQLDLAFCRAMKCIKCEGADYNFIISEGARVILNNFKDYVSYWQNHNLKWKTFSEEVGKVVLQAIRISIVLFSMENENLNSKIIDEESMVKACRLAIYFVDNLLEVISNSNFKKMLDDSWPLMYEIAIWQSSIRKVINAGVDVEEARRRLKLSKPKCDQLLYWMENMGWINHRVLRRTDQSGKSHVIEDWLPNVDFKELIKSFGGAVTD